MSFKCKLNSIGTAKILRTCQITETDKGLERVKIKVSDNKRIGDQIKIEKL